MNSIEQAHYKLKTLPKLKENWDSYGGKTISNISCEQAKQLLDKLLSFFCFPDDLFLCPTSQGEVSIEFSEGDYEFSIVCCEDGQISLFVDNRAGSESWVEEDKIYPDASTAFIRIRMYL